MKKPNEAILENYCIPCDSNKLSTMSIQQTIGYGCMGSTSMYTFLTVFSTSVCIYLMNFIQNFDTSDIYSLCGAVYVSEMLL